ncbi:hypothetical protein J2S97_003848 [Arthrobacter oryzae]|nr:hypothetical protein [Arthrobacter oryzae]
MKTGRTHTPFIGQSRDAARRGTMWVGLSVRGQ